jgi:hypothetical protein
MKKIKSLVDILNYNFIIPIIQKKMKNFEDRVRNACF